jgi:hypothetical protein
MTKRLPKVLGLVLFLLFISGSILLPAYHRAHCTDNDATHKADNCPVCQLANTPVISTSSDIAPIAVYLDSRSVDLPVLTVSVTSHRDATQARAPPVA